MKEYFKLQFRLINRKIIDLGLPLLIGYIGIPILFILLSNVVFALITEPKLLNVKEFIVYGYCLIALGLISKLNEPNRTDFLKFIFNKMEFRVLRIVENLLCCLPFTLILIYQQQFIPLILLNVAVISIAFFNFSTSVNFTIPTPFGKKPFEFTVGFRKTFFIFPVAYFLTYKSISVDNFNLGVFSMLSIVMVCYSYYLEMEDEYIVWNYNLSPKEFLIEKLRTSLLYFSVLCLPIISTLGVFFFSQIDTLIFFFLLCYAYLVTLILAKYSSFPSQINISQRLLIALSLGFVPIILVLIPFFYSQSIKKLNTVLND